MWAHFLHLTLFTGKKIDGIFTVNRLTHWEERMEMHGLFFFLPVSAFHACSAHRGQKGMPDPLDISNSCELLCGCWELNPSLLEEQPVLLTAELPLNPFRTFVLK